MKRLLALIVLPYWLSAQTREEVNLDQITENILAGIDIDQDETDNMENYTQLLAHPLDLNASTPEELRVLHVLTDNQIINLIRHRDLHGKLVSIHELQTIEGFDTETIRKLQRFIIVRDPSLSLNKALLQRIRDEGENYVMIRYDHALEKRRGFTAAANENQKFHGAPGRVAWRIRSYRPGDYSIGITAEKDPGEMIIWNPKTGQYGFDHVVMHAQVQNKGRIKNLIVGDFQAQFAQGLVWGGNIGFGKGAETITNARRTNIGFVPYTSAWEGGNLRGIASTVALSSHVFVSTFVSATRRDASVASDGDSETISSFSTTGLHRNHTEIAKRKAMRENAFGSVIQYSKNNLTVGTVFQRIGFESPVQPRSYLYNEYTFRGTEHMNTGFFADYTMNNISLFHESGKTIGGGHAMVNGTLISLSKRFDLALLYRRFQRDYRTFYANAFSENTKPENETGIYWGWKYKFPRRIVYSGYMDVFQFPGLRYRVYSPSVGYEWLMRLHWPLSRNASAFIQVREESKARNVPPSDQPLYQVSQNSKMNYWFNLEYSPAPELRMKTRFQASSYNTRSTFSNGYTLLQDVSLRKGKFSITGRYALFDTDDYDNRQYVYEHDVWLSYALPAYYGKGIRQYLLLQYKMNKAFTFWVRYSHTRFTDRESIGSGVDTIERNQQNDFKFEVRIRY